MILGIYGTGGAGREVRDIVETTALLRCRYEKIIFIDDTMQECVCEGLECMPFEVALNRHRRDLSVCIAVGEPKVKSILLNKTKQAGIKLESVIHPDNFISPSAVLKQGIIIQKGVTIQSNAVIEENVCLQRYAVIGHDTVIGMNSQISNHVAVGGYTNIGEGSYIGLNAAIRDRIKIGCHTIIGMGSVVVHDVADYAVVVGNPAKKIRENREEQVFKMNKK